MKDHPLRYSLANELHARPFPTLQPPCSAIYLAIKRSDNAASRDRSEDLNHLQQLLDRFGVNPPKPGATHWFGQLGKFTMKWEQHTEFVTYTLFVIERDGPAFDGKLFDLFPKDWLEAAPGVRLTSALFRIEQDILEDKISEHLDDWFIPESLAVSEVVDGEVVIAGDFRIDMSGHMRFAVFARADAGERRIGRVVQRVCEIETYKSMSMLGLARARTLGPRMGELDGILSGLMSDMQSGAVDHDTTLSNLLATSGELENMLAETSFRFGATAAYEAIVNQRIDVLRERRFHGRQTFAEFMMRRFDPAMRTVKSSEARLKTMAERAIRAGDLLRTRVDVERSAQNQKLLESMNKRADLQLRLQRTVEGLSVVAISYYAVNLVLNMIGPAASSMGLSNVAATALVTPAVIGAVWWTVSRIRRSVE
ncbi:MAG: DUF3422 domain-containing protein [Pseudomonadota bacterium]